MASVYLNSNVSAGDLSIATSNFFDNSKNVL